MRRRRRSETRGRRCCGRSTAARSTRTVGRSRTSATSAKHHSVSCLEDITAAVASRATARSTHRTTLTCQEKKGSSGSARSACARWTRRTRRSAGGARGDEARSRVREEQRCQRVGSTRSRWQIEVAGVGGTAPQATDKTVMTLTLSAAGRTCANRRQRPPLRS